MSVQTCFLRSLQICCSTIVISLSTRSMFWISSSLEKRAGTRSKSGSIWAGLTGEIGSSFPMALPRSWGKHWGEAWAWSNTYCVTIRERKKTTLHYRPQSIYAVHTKHEIHISPEGSGQNEEEKEQMPVTDVWRGVACLTVCLDKTDWQTADTWHWPNNNTQQRRQTL